MWAHSSDQNQMSKIDIFKQISNDTPVFVGDCVMPLFCYEVLSVVSSIIIISLRRRELVVLL